MKNVRESKEYVVFFFVGVLSMVAFGLIAYLLLFHRTMGEATSAVSLLPAINAALNAISGVFLFLGYRAIKAKKRDLHERLMKAAVLTSACFLLGYLTHHYLHGDTRYPGAGMAKTIYLSILLSHILASVASFPLILMTLYYALRGQFNQHPRVARIAWPLWMYVSVTGVLVYVLLALAN